MRAKFGEDMNLFANREDAGKIIAGLLKSLCLSSPTLLAISRGGVPVAAGIAKALSWRVQLLLLHPLRLPHDPENPFGCIDSRGELYLNQALVGQLRVSPVQIRQLARRQLMDLEHDLLQWRIPAPATLEGQTAILVDEGMHTGWTMFSGVSAARALGVQRLITACPVSHQRAMDFLRAHCQEVICPVVEKQPLYSIDSHFQDFSPVTNDHIQRWMANCLVR
jgi:putative phosphoribosyl transferase